MYLIKTPFWLRLLYPSLIWRMPDDSKTIYLTFDDGPIPIVTPFVLKKLKAVNARATFFCIGDNVRKHPEVYHNLINEGHSIGSHTFNHLRGWSTPCDEYVANALKAIELTGSLLFRPPHGRIKKRQIQKLREEKPDLKIFMWDVLSADYDADVSPQRCLDNVLRHTQPGSIVVFHDSLKAFPRLEYVLPRALEVWQKKGYKFAAL